MGFKTKVLTTDSNGINYIIGSPRTVKFNAKDGAFAELGMDAGQESMTVQILKDVKTQKIVLYPHGDTLIPKEHTVLMFRDLETDDICSGLIKTFSEGEYVKFERALNRASKELGKDIDATDVECTMTWEKLPKGSNGYYAISFTFCKDSDGEPVPYLVEKGGKLEVNQKAKIQFLPTESYDRSLRFYVETCQNGELLFDYRLGEEIVKNNVDETKVDKASIPSLPIKALSHVGFFSKETAKNLIKSSSQLQLA